MPPARSEPRSRRPPIPRRRRARVVIGVIAAMVVAFSAIVLARDLRPSASLENAFTCAPRVPRPVHRASPTVRLAVAGDAGTADASERAVASAMDAVEDDREYDALLLLGDNIYSDGDPAKVQAAVFDPFRTVLDGPTRLLAVLGNHDVDSGHRDEQAAALGMPGRWYATTIGDTLILSLDSNDPGNPDQLAWLERTLASTTATWKIAMMHHPPYSAGSHGSSLDVRRAFVPMFECFGVQLVLAGHDHDYQRSKTMNGVTYVVSGGAGHLRPTGHAAFTEYSTSTLHFLDIEISNEALTLQAIDQRGERFDSVTLAPGS